MPPHHSIARTLLQTQDYMDDNVKKKKVKRNASKVMKINNLFILLDYTDWLQ